jgi:Zn-dependent metalloprotease
LQKGEALDVINVQALFQTETDETGFGSVEKVAHHVVFGHTYKAVPIDGGAVLVVLDSDGAVSTFHKAWRDITGEIQVKLASESTINARRDPDKMTYLIEKARTCALTEDSDPGAIHDAAGVGCKFTYSDPLGGAGLSRSVEEWVNAADDASIPLKGKKPAKPATL